MPESDKSVVDIVERLRAGVEYTKGVPASLEAANEIEALRGRIDRAAKIMAGMIEPAPEPHTIESLFEAEHKRRLASGEAEAFLREWKDKT